MTNTKKILCVLFALVALTFVMAISAFAAEHTVSTPDDFIKYISVKNSGSGEGALANDGDTVRLLNHIDTGNAYYYVDKAITIDLNGFTLTTSTSSGGIRLRDAGASLINGKLLHTGGTCALKVWWADRIEDLEIEVTNTAGTRGGIVLQENSTASINTIKDVYIHGAGLTNGIQTYNCGLTPCAIGTMENVTIEATRCALWINANCGTATGCTFKGGESAIEIWTKAGYTAAIDLNDCSVEGGTQAINIAVQETVGTIDFKADVDTTISSESGVLFTNSSNVGVSNSTGAVEFEVPGYNEGTNGSFSKDCVGHEYAVSEIIIAPTCKAEGKAIVVCSLCGDAQYSKLAVSEHSYETTVTEPTCKDAGYTTHTCSVCGDTYNDNEVPATEEHSYIESGRTETEVTYTCDVCGDSYTEEINTHKHTEVKIPAIPSTSKTTGMTSGIKCAECGEILVAPKPAVTGFKVNASLSLGEDISMYINVLIPTENGLLVEGSYVVAEFPEITVVDTLQTITESKYDSATGRYKFRFTSTKAQFMTDTMTFTAYACDENGIESAYNVPAYSMVQYIVGLYQTAKANNDTKQVTLLSDLLELGSATQIFMGYKADTLVTAVAEEMLGYEIAPSTFVAPTNSVAKVDRDGKDTSLVDFRTFGLRLGNVMKPTLYFEDKGDLTGYTVKVFVDGVEQETVYGDLDTLETDANGRRILEISSGIKVLAYDKDIVAKFYDANGNETGSVITISVNSYFALNYSKSPAREQAFMRAIYNYGASADAFFN